MSTHDEEPTAPVRLTEAQMDALIEFIKEAAAYAADERVDHVYASSKARRDAEKQLRELLQESGK